MNMKIKKPAFCRLNITFWIIPLFLIILNILPACNGASVQKSNTGGPKINITAPAENAPAGSIDVVVDVSNFTLVDKEGGNNKGGEGHIIYYLDVPVPTYYDHTAITLSGTYNTDFKTSYTWQNVSPGTHTFSVQLVNNNNKPLPVSAVDTVKITIGAPEGNPGITVKAPQDGTKLPPGNIIIAVKISNFIISKEDMGSINRTGEGHVIYYIDEDPPVEQGKPAVTETSVVSVDTSNLWRTVTEGQHSFSVQLVNNDDTPLKIPVTAKVNINVKP